MKSQEIRRRFLEFFKKRGHIVIPSSSLVPENDPSVLFTTAGMHPLVPYLLGARHPQGDKLVNAQKCVRTQDIEEVGDNTHDTFFEMLGNWSLGSYFKEDAIMWSYEFLTSKEEGLGLDPTRLYVTCFAGDKDAPRDEESAKIWKVSGIPSERIYFFGKEENWWSPGENGPCGPDTEMFYDVTKEGLGDLTQKEFEKADNKEDVVEIWNDVFMEYEKKAGKITGKLAQKNVDTGAGLERLAMVMQKKNNIFDTDLFVPLMQEITMFSTVPNMRAKRIVADHIRTAVFLIADGVTPANTERGYVLRRLVRRAARYAGILNIPSEKFTSLPAVVIETYKDVYPTLFQKAEIINKEIQQEEEKFRDTLAIGLREFKKIQENPISGKTAFHLYQSYGFPIEMVEELAREREMTIDKKEFYKEFKKHQEVSRTGAEKKFKGGLADTSEVSVQYHTATHLLHQALRDVLGNHVFQRGSNITPERLRFDFNFERKITDEEIEKVQHLVNQKIKEGLPVTHDDISLEEAKKIGAVGLFEKKYNDRVRVYKIAEYSLEICGGPHVKNTADLKGFFRIKKEKAISAGVRRIKAVLDGNSSVVPNQQKKA